jgi:hypothetical protein
MRRVSRMSRTQQGQPRPKEKGKWRRLVARLVEKTREEREATREMDEEGGEVGRSRSGREPCGRKSASGLKMGAALKNWAASFGLAQRACVCVLWGMERTLCAVRL